MDDYYKKVQILMEKYRKWSCIDDFNYIGHWGNKGAKILYINDSDPDIAKEVIESMTKNLGLDHEVIIVLTTARDDKKLIEKMDIIIEKYGKQNIFFGDELLLDPPASKLVPNHCLVSDEDILWLKKNHIPSEKLLTMTLDNPVAKWMDLSLGQIVKIYRDNGTIYFRRVF